MSNSNEVVIPIEPLWWDASRHWSAPILVLSRLYLNISFRSFSIPTILNSEGGSRPVSGNMQSSIISSGCSGKRKWAFKLVEETSPGKDS